MDITKLLVLKVYHEYYARFLVANDGPPVMTDLAIVQWGCIFISEGWGVIVNLDVGIQLRFFWEDRPTQYMHKKGFVSTSVGWMIKERKI